METPLGLDMSRFPTAKLSPRTLQSDARLRSGKTGKGNRYLKSALGEAAAAQTSLFGGRSSESGTRAACVARRHRRDRRPFSPLANARYALSLSNR
jgi:transposase